MALTYTDYGDGDTLLSIRDKINTFNQNVVTAVNALSTTYAVGVAAVENPDTATVYQSFKNIIGVVPTVNTPDTLSAGVLELVATSDYVSFQGGKSYLVEVKFPVRALDIKRYFKIRVGTEVISSTLIFSQRGDVDMNTILTGVYKPSEDKDSTVTLVVMAEKDLVETITGSGDIIFTAEEVN